MRNIEELNEPWCIIQKRQNFENNRENKIREKLILKKTIPLKKRYGKRRREMNRSRKIINAS